MFHQGEQRFLKLPNVVVRRFNVRTILLGEVLDEPMQNQGRMLNGRQNENDNRDAVLVPNRHGGELGQIVNVRFGDFQ